MHEPHIVIVGRPNVGKSTLFNRLLGKRRAIIDSEAGITRDPISESITIEQYSCILSDTAGLVTESNKLNALISQKNSEVIQNADIILFMLDVTEVNAEDEEAMNYLRPYSQKILLLVNKVDNEKRNNLVYEFYRYGFTPLLSLSAVQQSGIDDLIEEIRLRLEKIAPKEISPRSASTDEAVADREEAEKEEAGREEAGQPEKNVIPVLVLGQPNTGKSTLVNYLSEGEKSIVSDTPGTTRDILYRSFSYNSQRFQIIDSAGIRRKKKVTDNVEYYSVNRAISAIEQAEVILLLIDVQKGLSEQDKKIAQQAVKLGRGIILLLNKWDLLDDTPNQLEAIRDRVQFLFPILHFAPILPLSAYTGLGIPDLLNTVIRVREQLHKRIGTGKLNKALQSWKEYNPPPIKKQHRYKLKYIVHVSTLPSTFVLFVSKKHGLPESYTNYIKNKIRSTFELREIPLRVEIRDNAVDT